MARYLRLDVLNEIIATGLVPVFYHKDVETSKKIIDALAEGGVRAIEFTNRGDNAYRVFSDLVMHYAKANPALMLGVGSIVEPFSAGMYIASGANFVVGPNFNEDIARLCNRRKISYSPGCGSVTEISRAEEFGAELVKIFPGESIGGPSFVKSVLGPMPWVRIMPTGGVEVSAEGIKQWFSAGVSAVGIGSNLIRKSWIENGEYEKITDLTTQILSWIRQARGKSVFSGFDHVGIYPSESPASSELKNWYKDLFGFKEDETKSAFFLSGTDMGRLEISKVEAGLKAHIAIRVTDFEVAAKSLTDKGIELDEPILLPNMKIAYLHSGDPAGNRVHIVWRKS